MVPTKQIVVNPDNLLSHELDTTRSGGSHLEDLNETQRQPTEVESHHNLPLPTTHPIPHEHPSIPLFDVASQNAGTMVYELQTFSASTNAGDSLTESHGDTSRHSIGGATEWRPRDNEKTGVPAQSSTQRRAEQSRMAYRAFKRRRAE